MGRVRWMLLLAAVAANLLPTTVDGRDCTNASFRVAVRSPVTELTAGVSSGVLSISDGAQLVMRLAAGARRGGVVSVSFKGTPGQCELFAQASKIPDTSAPVNNGLAPVSASVAAEASYVAEGAAGDNMDWFFVLEGSSGGGGCTDASVTVSAPEVSALELGDERDVTVGLGQYVLYELQTPGGAINTLTGLKVSLKGTSGSCSAYASYRDLALNSTNMVTSTSSITAETAWVFPRGYTEQGTWYIAVTSLNGGCTDGKIIATLADTHLVRDSICPAGNCTLIDIPADDVQVWTFVAGTGSSGLLKFDAAADNSFCQFYVGSSLPFSWPSSETFKTEASTGRATRYILADGGTDDTPRLWWVVVGGAGGQACTSGAQISVEAVPSETINSDHNGVWMPVPSTMPSGDVTHAQWLAKFDNPSGLTNYQAALTVSIRGSDGDCEASVRYGAIGDRTDRVPVTSAGNGTIIHGLASGYPDDSQAWYVSITSANGGSGCSGVEILPDIKVSQTLASGAAASSMAAHPSAPAGGVLVAGASLLYKYAAEAGKGGTMEVTLGGNSTNCELLASAGAVPSANDTAQAAGTTKSYAANGFGDNVDWFFVLRGRVSGDGCVDASISILSGSTFSMSSGMTPTVIPALSYEGMTLVEVSAPAGEGAVLRAELWGDTTKCQMYVHASTITTSQTPHGADLRLYYVAEGIADFTSGIKWMAIIESKPGTTCTNPVLIALTEPVQVLSPSDFGNWIEASTTIGRYAAIKVPLRYDGELYPSLESSLEAESGCTAAMMTSSMDLSSPTSPVSGGSSGSAYAKGATSEMLDTSLLQPTWWFMVLELCPGGWCGDCFPGTHSDVWNIDFCLPCSPGTYAPGVRATSCITASPGYFVAGTGNTTHTPCPSGTYQPNSGQSECIPCPSGSSAAPGSTSCVLCPQGSVASSLGSSNCTACPPGTFSDASGNQQCTNSPPGSFSAGVGSFNYEKCPIGTYQEEHGQVQCKICPGGSTTLSLGSQNSTQCVCPEGLYGDPALRNEPCFPCPSMAVCDEGSEFPHALPGYWLSSMMPSSVSACIPSSACTGGVSACSTGYSGDACEDCVDGYYRSRGRCVECSSWSPPQWMLVTAIVLMTLVPPLCFCCGILVCGYIGAYRRFRGPFKWQTSGKNSICRRCVATFISGTGVMAALRFLGFVFSLAQLTYIVVWLDDVSWPSSIDGYLSVLSLLSLRFDDLIQLECGDSTWTYAHTYIFRLCSPLVLALGHCVVTMAAFCIYHTSSRCFTGRTRRLVSYQASLSWTISIRIVLVVLNLFYIFLHSSVVELFMCSTRSGDTHFFLLAEPTIECFTSDGTWAELLPWAVLGAIFYSIGIPLLIFTTLCCKSSSRAKPWPSKRYGFLWNKYKDRFIRWEARVVVFKFLVVLSMALSSYETQQQVNYLFLISLFYFVMQVRKLPYQYRWEGRLEIAIVFAFFAIVVSAYIFLASDTIGTATVTFFEVFVMGAHGCVWFLILWILFWDAAAAGMCGCFKRLCSCCEWKPSAAPEKNPQVHPEWNIDGVVNLSPEDYALIAEPASRALDWAESAKAQLVHAVRRQRKKRSRNRREHGVALPDCSVNELLQIIDSIDGEVRLLRGALAVPAEPIVPENEDLPEAPPALEMRQEDASDDFWSRHGLNRDEKPWPLSRREMVEEVKEPESLKLQASDDEDDNTNEFSPLSSSKQASSRSYIRPSSSSDNDKDETSGIPDTNSAETSPMLTSVPSRKYAAGLSRTRMPGRSKQPSLVMEAIRGTRDTMAHIFTAPLARRGKPVQRQGGLMPAVPMTMRAPKVSSHWYNGPIDSDEEDETRDDLHIHSYLMPSDQVSNYSQVQSRTSSLWHGSSLRRSSMEYDSDPDTTTKRRHSINPTAARLSAAARIREYYRNHPDAIPKKGKTKADSVARRKSIAAPGYDFKRRQSSAGGDALNPTHRELGLSRSPMKGSGLDGDQPSIAFSDEELGGSGKRKHKDGGTSKDGGDSTPELHPAKPTVDLSADGLDGAQAGQPGSSGKFGDFNTGVAGDPSAGGAENGADGKQSGKVGSKADQAEDGSAAGRSGLILISNSDDDNESDSNEDGPGGKKGRRRKGKGSRGGATGQDGKKDNGRRGSVWRTQWTEENTVEAAKLSGLSKDTIRGLVGGGTLTWNPHTAKTFAGFIDQPALITAGSRLELILKHGMLHLLDDKGRAHPVSPEPKESAEARRERKRSELMRKHERAFRILEEKKKRREDEQREEQRLELERQQAEAAALTKEASAPVVKSEDEDPATKKERRRRALLRKHGLLHKFKNLIQEPSKDGDNDTAK